MKSLNKIKSTINKNVNGEVYLKEWHKSIVLEGKVKSWDDVVKAGQIAANKGYKGVVNNIEVEGFKNPPIKAPSIKDGTLDGKKVDVLVIGGGVTGCSILRELSKWDISCLLVDKEEDVAMHASSRNDGMVHPGVEPKPGSNKARFNVEGNRLYTQIAKELDVPLNRTGSLVLFDKKILKAAFPIVDARRKKNGLDKIKLVSQSEIKKYEPYADDNVGGALFFPSTAITCPYKMTVAYGENAVMNGAEISLNTIVLSIHKEGDKIVYVETNRGKIFPKVVIDAAGCFADAIADMAGDKFFTIHPRKGEILILDKKKGRLLHSVLAKPSLTLVKGNTKGGGIVKTVDGNILVGPDAYEQPLKEDFSTHMENINAIANKHFPILPGINKGDIITYFAGVRAATYEEDFIVEKSEYVENLIYAAGIQSPGFASAPAISREIEGITINVLSKMMKVKKKENFNPYRKGIPDLRFMSDNDRRELIKKRPDYGVIVCRCEEISKGEIIDAINSPIPTRTIDGIKRRVRPGMGRCQGGFCMPQVLNIISKEKGINPTKVTKKGEGSNILISETKQSK